MGRKKIVTIGVDTGSYDSFIQRILYLGRGRVSSSVCVANVHMVVEAHRDSGFSAIVNDADLVTPDGMPLAKSMYALHGIKQERVAGMDLVPDILAAAADAGLSIFFYGSTDDVLTAVVNRLACEHPQLEIAGAYSPPFRQLSDEEGAAIVDRINRSGANIVLVALGCPKQERWMAGVKGKVNAVMVGIGGALPVYAGLQRRAPYLFQRFALEWLFRLCQEPRRLLKRYITTNTTFLILLFGQWLSRRNFFRSSQ